VTRSFTLEVEVRAPRARLHALLCNLESLRPLHPLIESVEAIEPLPELPRARRWRVTDRVPVGPVRVRTTYVAAIEPVSDGEIRGHAWQPPGVRLTTVYTLTEAPGGTRTRLQERCRVEAPFGLAGFVLRRARHAHAAMLERLKDWIEGAEA